MKCPVCTETSLVMADRKGVEIDYCPDCRGVWLDRGELDKIIERSAEYQSPAPAAQSPGPTPPAEAVHRERRYEEPRRSKSDKHDRKYRKKNRMADMLGDIFDF